MPNKYIEGGEGSFFDTTVPEFVEAKWRQIANCCCCSFRVSLLNWGQSGCVHGRDKLLVSLHDKLSQELVTCEVSTHDRGVIFHWFDK